MTGPNESTRLLHYANADAERALIGCLLVDAQAAQRINGIQAGDFAFAETRAVWEACQRVIGEGHKPTVGNVGLALGEDLQRIGGNQMLELCEASCVSSELAPEHARVVREVAAKRRLRSLAQESVEDLDKGHDVGAVSQRLRAAVLAAAESGARDAALSIMGIDDLFALELNDADNLLGERLLARGEVLAMFGQGGIGKSRLMLQLAVDSILGRPFAGVLETHDQTAKWLIFQTENNARRLRADLGGMLRGLTKAERDRVAAQLRILVPLKDEDRFVSVDDTQAVARMMTTVRAFQPDVVCFDPLADFFGGDNASDPVQMKETYRTLRRIARAGKPDAAVLILHHSLTGKKAAAGAVGYDRASFGRDSKALYNAVRAALNVAPGDEEGGVLVVGCGKNNNGPSFAPFALRLNESTMLFEPDEAFDLTGWRAEVEGRKAKPEPIRVELVALCLRELGGRTTRKALVERLKALSGRGDSVAYDAVKRAEGAGLLSGDRFNVELRT